MAVRHNITKEDEWFTNTDRNLDFEVLDADPQENALAAPIDIASGGYTMSWTLSEDETVAAVKHINAHAVTIVGVYNANRALNTQRARVTILASETASIEGNRIRYHELRRTNAGAKAVLCFGDAYLWQSPV